MTDIYEHAMWTDSVAIYPDAGQGTDRAISYVGLQLCSEAGEVAGKLAKMFRDDGGLLTEERYRLIRKELGDVYWYAARLCRELGIDPREILDENIDKLTDRHERDALKGDGDER